MGGKAKMQQPPATNVENDAKLAESEAKLEKEKAGMLSSKKRGMYGTILTSGQGVEEEASTSKTMLGGGNPLSQEIIILKKNKTLTKRQQQAMKKHAKHHTKKVLADMKRQILAGKSFTEAHKKAPKKKVKT